MKRRSFVYTIIVVLLGTVAVCTTTRHRGTKPDRLQEQPLTIIPFSGPGAVRDAELSGLAWYEDWLILLPQYPDRIGDGDGAVLAIPRIEILTFLDGEITQPLKPRRIPFLAPGLAESIEGFDGYEAIAFEGDQVFLTIEVDGGETMSSCLLRGQMAEDMSKLTVFTHSQGRLSCPAPVHNIAYEVILVLEDTIITFFEANGRAINESPHGLRFDHQLNPLNQISFPNIEFRITDATATDSEGRFWAINYHWHGEEALAAEIDPIAERFGTGATHEASRCVERLIEFRYAPNGVSLSGEKPILLELLPDDECRNWEGIVRLDQRGFLLVTDKFPETILAFVPMPEDGD